MSDSKKFNVDKETIRPLSPTPGGPERLPVQTDECLVEDEGVPIQTDKCTSENPVPIQTDDCGGGNTLV